MRVLISLTYYRPYISGVTVYAERLARALAARGHEPRILTSAYEPGLPLVERRAGVAVYRVPMAFRVSKGAIMPAWPGEALRQLAWADVALLNLPNTPVEALGLPVLARLARCPVAAVYHCDVEMPAGAMNRVVDAVVHGSNRAAAALVRRVVAYTEDYAEHSRLLRRLPGKRVVIPPPVALAPAPSEALRAFRRRHAPAGEYLVGFPARFAAEKGVETLLEAWPRLCERLDRPLRLLFAGEYENVIGEEETRRRLMPRVEALGEDWRFLGVLEADAMGVFYRAVDATILPSVNRTESFGLVQVESMLAGTPVVASTLPGVREPIRRTGMGLGVPPGDAPALAQALERVLREPEAFIREREEIERHFSMARTIKGYEALFTELAGAGRPTPARRPAPRPAPGHCRPAAGRDHLAFLLRRVPPHLALIRAREARLLAALGPLPQPLLDLGCGDGAFAEAALLDRPAWGLDPDPDALAVARRRGRHRELLEAPAHAIPLPDAAAATVLANSVLEHIEDLDATLDEIDRVLAPGGRLVFCGPGPRFLETLPGARLCPAYGHWFNRLSRHYRCEGPETWGPRLAARGFAIDHAESYFDRPAQAAFELCHYLGLPRLAARRLTGHWTLWPRSPANRLLRAWLGPHVRRPCPGEGANWFLVARKEQR